MSSEGFQVYNLLSKKYDFLTKPEFGTMVGNEARMKAKYSPISGLSVNSNGTSIWQISNDSFMASDVKLQVKYNFQFQLIDTTATPPAPVAFTPANFTANMADAFGVNSFPVNKCITSLVARVNGNYSVTTEVAADTPIYIHGENHHHLATLSQASEIDKYYQNSSIQLSSSLRAGYNTIDSIQSRGVYSRYEVGEPTVVDANTVSVPITITESILAAPFQYNSKNPNPFFGIDDLYLKIQWGDLSVVPMATVDKINAFNGTANRQLQLFASTIADVKLVIDSSSPMVQVPRPPVVYYDCPQITKYPEASALLAAGASFPKTYQNHVLNGMPKMFVIYAPYQRTANALNSNADSFAVITKIQLSLGNHPNMLLDLDTMNDLYQLSWSNGYNGRFAQFAGEGQTVNGVNAVGTGSILYIRPSDLGLSEGMQSNADGVFNIGLTVTFKNQTAVQQTYQPMLACIYDNVITYRDSKFTEDNVMLDRNQVLGAPVRYIDDNSHLNNIIGGGFWGDVWNGIKKVATNPVTKALSQTVRNIPGVSKYVGDDTAIGSVAKSVGYGKKGKGLLKIGGGKMDKAELRQAINSL